MLGWDRRKASRWGENRDKSIGQIDPYKKECESRVEKKIINERKQRFRGTNSNI